MHEGIYEELKRVAKAQATTTYTVVAELAGLDLDDPDGRDALARMLSEISAHEHTHGRPLLSVVVIHPETNLPGQEFFALAYELGLYEGQDMIWEQLTRTGFFTRELAKVHAAWQ